eukprot:s485_g10.t1
MRAREALTSGDTGTPMRSHGDVSRHIGGSWAGPSKCRACWSGARKQCSCLGEVRSSVKLCLSERRFHASSCGSWPYRVIRSWWLLLLLPLLLFAVCCLLLLLLLLLLFLLLVMVVVLWFFAILTILVLVAVAVAGVAAASLSKYRLVQCLKFLPVAEAWELDSLQ